MAGLLLLKALPLCVSNCTNKQLFHLSGFNNVVENDETNDFAVVVG